MESLWVVTTSPHHRFDYHLIESGAGSPGARGPAFVGFHKSGRTFATRMAQAGVDLAALAPILGHSTVRKDERYVRITPKHKPEAMRRYKRTLKKAAGGEEVQRPVSAFVDDFGLIWLDRANSGRRNRRAEILLIQSAIEKYWRRGWESNPRIKVLQTSPLPLGYRAPYEERP